MVDPKAAKFINSLVKSLQMLCHGCVDFNHNIEIIGHINLRIDNSQKFDYIVNEQVSKQGDDSTYFQSNSYHSLPPPKSSREKEKHQASSRTEDGASVLESATNHHRLDSATVTGSRVQIDLSGPIPVAHEVESSPEHRFSISSNTSSGSRRPSHNRDFSGENEQNRLHDPQISFDDHAHNHSCSSGATTRERETLERPASSCSSNERTDISSVFVGKDSEKGQQDCEGVIGQDGSVIVKAEPDDTSVEAVMEEEDQQEQDLLGIPSVSSVLPMAHQSALVANAAHPGHAMFATATLGHHGMFDSSLSAQDDADGGRASYVQEAFMQQILSAQKPTHLSHPGPELDVFPLTMHRNVRSKETYLHPAPAHIQMPESLSHLSSSGLSLPLHSKLPLIPPVLPPSKLPDVSLISHKEVRLDRGRGRGRGLGRVHFRCNDLLVSAKERFPCSYCDYASVRRYNLERHIRLRHPSYRYKCPLPACGMILLDETELNTHIVIHDTISIVVCYGCNLPFDSWGTLSHHQQVCRGFEGHPTVKIAQGGSGKGRRYKMGSLISGCDLNQEAGDSGMCIIKNAEHSAGSRSTEFTDSVVSRLVEHAEHVGGKPVEHTELSRSSESRLVEHSERGENAASRSVVHSETSMESDGGVEVVDYTDNLPVHFLKKDPDTSEEESGHE